MTMSIKSNVTLQNICVVHLLKNHTLAFLLQLLHLDQQLTIFGLFYLTSNVL